MPGRRLGQRLGAHGHRRRAVILVDRQGQGPLRAARLDQVLRPGLAVDHPQLGRGPAALLHHQVPAEHVAAHQPGVLGRPDDLGPAQLGPRGRARRRGGRPDQPELGRPGVGDEIELAPARPVGMVCVVFGAPPSFFRHKWFGAGVPRRDHQGLGGVPGRRLDQQPYAAAGGPDGQLEPLVVLPVDQRVALRRGAGLMPPDLVRAARRVGDDVQQRPGVRGPGQPVVRALDALGQVGAGRQVPDPQLVHLAAGEVDRVGQVPPVRADLADTQLRVAAGAGRVLQQEVLVQQHRRRGPRGPRRGRTAPAAARRRSW